MDVPPLGGDAAEVADAEERSDLRHLARNTVLKFGGSLSYGVLSLLVVVVITRGLGAGGSGELFEAIALFIIASNAAELGADTGAVRMIARYRATGRSQDVRPTLAIGMIPVFGFGVLLAVAIFVLAPHLADAFGQGAHRERIALYLRVFAVFVPLNATQTVVVSATRGFHSMLPLVLVTNVAQPATRTLLMLVVLAAGVGGIAVALAWAGPIAAGLAAMALILVKLLRRAEREDRYEGEPRPVRSLASEFWRFSLPRALAAIFATTVLWLDTLLVGGLDATRSAGVYTATSRFSQVGLAALGAILVVMAPQVSAMLAQGRLDRAGSVYRVSTWWLMAPTWPLYMAIMVFAPFLLQIFGDEFVRGQHALVIMSLAMLVSMATGPVTTVLLMSGKSLWNLANAVVATVLNVGLNLVLIPRIGIAGAAIAWSAAIAVNNLAALGEVWILTGLHPFGPGFATTAIGAVMCFGGLGVLGRWALGPSVLTFALYLAVATPLYLVVLWRSRRWLQLSIFRGALATRGRGGGDG